MKTQIFYILLLLFTCNSSFAQWLCPWEFKKELIVKNPTNENLANYQIQVDIPFSAGMNPDFSDLRFTLSDGTTLIDYWVETYTASNRAVVWVEFPSLLAQAKAEFFMYYGNSSASSASNGLNTFLFFDDFEDEDIWTSLGNNSIDPDNTTFPGITTLKKISNCDPNGGWAPIGSTIENFRFITREYREDLSTGCNLNRYGVENSDFDGYNIRRSAVNNGGNSAFGWERRDNERAVDYVGTNLAQAPDNWYRTELRRCKDNIEAHIFDDKKSLIGSQSDTDTTVNKFDRVTVRGGWDYFFDHMAIAQYVCDGPEYDFGNLVDNSPTVTCQNINILLGVDGTVVIDAQDIEADSEAVCGTLEYSVDKEKFDCDDIGTNAVTLTVTDIFDNTATCIASVNVSEDIDPEISCPANIVTLANTRVCSAEVRWDIPMATDNCEVTEIRSSHNPGDIFPLGQTIVTYKVSDASGNDASCTFTVTVTNSANAEITISETSATTDDDGTLCDGDQAILDAGSGFHSYLWSDGSTTQQISTSINGSHTVTVTDNNGCQDRTSTNLTILKLPNAGTCDIVHDYCHSNNGQVTIKASDGAPPYDIDWSPNVGSSSSSTIPSSGGTITITNIPAGTSIDITVTDAQGCQAN